MKDSLQFHWIKDISSGSTDSHVILNLSEKLQGNLDSPDGLTDKRITNHVINFYSAACSFRNRINTQPMVKIERKYD